MVSQEILVSAAGASGRTATAGAAGTATMLMEANMKNSFELLYVGIIRRFFLLCFEKFSFFESFVCRSRVN